jgi:DNA (cytosine-5)-methyltransferase 1
VLGGHILGWRTVCAVEFDSYARRVLLARQRDGCLPRFPIWDDVRTFDARPWRGTIDVVSGGFPCQDVSAANRNAKGLDGARSGLWSEFARIIGEARPKLAFIENSPALRSRGLDRVLKDLAGMGYDAAWGVLGGPAVGAPHRRNRMWIVAADAHMPGERDVAQHAALAGAPSVDRAPRPSRVTAHAHGARVRLYGQREAAIRREDLWWPMSVIEGVDDGLAHRVDRVRATGNGQIPAVAAVAFNGLVRRLGVIT